MNIDPREWDLQERALREDAAYREVARALRRSPGEPPADFAASVAALVAPAPAPAREDLLEHWLLRAFAMVLAIAFISAIAHYGSLWLEGFEAIAPLLGGSTALNWAVAAGACVVLSWAFAQGGARLHPPRR
jgi:hypothetical protein